MTTNRIFQGSSLLFVRLSTTRNAVTHNHFHKHYSNRFSIPLDKNKASKVKYLRYITGSIVISGIGSSIYYYFQKEKRPINNLDNQQHKIILSPTEATLKLRENQLSFLLHRNNGVYRYDTNQLASNSPIEDTKYEEIDSSTKNDGDRLFFGVFDGHSGWNTSKLLSKKLVPTVKEQLNKAYDGCGEYAKLFHNKGELVKKAIQKGFVELDEEIVFHSIDRLLNTPTNEPGGISYINESLLSALSGSCALLAYIETATNDLYIACTGDSRAIMGVKDSTGEWKALQLSEDQTGRNENEVSRLSEEHPGESNIITNGRVFGGLEPTRAFGDAKYKWDRNLQEIIYTKFFKEKRKVPGNDKFRTPPYVIARPEVIHHKIEADDKFLVLATDGLWEKLSNTEVIELVGRLIDERRNGKDGDDSKELIMSKSKKAFAFVDENASTHLIRNALGGASEDALCAILSLPAPMSRRWRDDITVTVVFFGKD
ncbi:5394_t:CDS:2 [Acaulospora colombiana]|uniref:5394_t:CDS:1 n=1 Tax=Acaulospora colombiana TaxID=27376 RepID=A0ACA9MAA6_9GLOM|nr:5394_t:CDS:2 [Acaulospora colombiana]